MSLTAYIFYALAWLSFGAVHSLLADQRVKARFKSLLGRTYRLVYNFFALFHFGVVVYGGRYLIGSSLPVFDLPPFVHQVQVGMMVLGVLIFIVALWQYDLGRFAGLSQLFQAQSSEIVEPLQLGGLNRFVRHPLYTGAHLYFWGSVRTEFDLLTALWASSYFVIGSLFEERKLIADYGAAYVDYKKRVPSVIPWRGRAI